MSCATCFLGVTLHTVAIYAEKTFAHLHAPSAGFHARRQIGGLLPDIDRGTSGITLLLGGGAVYHRAHPD